MRKPGPNTPAPTPGAEAVRQIARTLGQALADQGLSLRAAPAGSGVNRQAIADLPAGRSWPDVATIARLNAFTGIRLWLQQPTCGRKREQ